VRRIIRRQTASAAWQRRRTVPVDSAHGTSPLVDDEGLSVAFAGLAASR
jgi:hypothetical protein